MRRDMEVIRKILLASMDSDGPIEGVEGIEARVFAAHAELLEEAGLAKCHIVASSDSADPTPLKAIIWRLTWDGFDFACSIQDQTLWERVCDWVIKPTGAWTFALLRQVIEYELRHRLRIGID